MTDVFISYSRKDIAFTRLLHEALVENNLETWIDWQDIPPSADWLAEVYEAIEVADAFIFIISETSLASEICGLEITHATKHNKRLIPIIIKDVEAEKVPKELSVLNWIFFDDAGEKFTEAMEDLVTAITVDQDWVKTHTRIENRALAWDRKDNDRGLLLRGADLSEAESWLAGSAGKDPQPTALQTEYILKSREDATRRQRMTLMGVGAALVVAVGLGILAWTQRNLAVSQSNARATAQVEAEQERDIAKSGYLGMQSISHVENNIDLALLLSSEAIKIHPSLEAKSSLLMGLTQYPHLDSVIYRNGDVWIRSLAISPDGRYLVGSSANNIFVWDLTSGAIISQIDISTLFEPGISEVAAEIWGLTFLRGNDLLAGCITYSDYYPTQNNCFYWDRDTDTLDFYFSENFLCSSQEVQSSIGFHPEGRFLLLFSPNPGGDITLSSWDTHTGNQISEIESGFTDTITASKFSRDGSLFVAGSQNGEVRFWNIDSTGIIQATAETSILDISSQKIQGIAIAPSGSQLLISSGDETSLWDTETGSWIKGYSYSGFEPVQVAFTSEGTPLVSVSLDDEFKLYDGFSGMKIGGNLTLTDMEYGVSDLVLMPDSGKIITSGRLDSFGGTVIYAWNFHEEYKFLRKVDEDNGFKAYSVTTWEDEGEVVVATGGCANYEGHDCLLGEIRIWKPDNEEFISTSLVGHKGYVSTLEISPDGNRLASGSADGTIILWEINTGEMISDELAGHTDRIIDLAFNTDGSFLASSSYQDNSSILVWDMTTIGDIAFILGDESEKYNPRKIQFSSAGSLFVSSNGKLDIWELSAGEDATSAKRIESSTLEGVFVLDSAGGRVISGSTGGITILDSIDLERLVTPTTTGLLPHRIQSLDFNDTANLIATTTLDKNLVFWDGDTGQIIGNPISLDNTSGIETIDIGPNHLVFSPDGNWLVTGGEYGIKIWDIQQNNWIDYACDIAGRNLSQEEWRTFMGDRSYQETCPELP